MFLPYLKLPLYPSQVLLYFSTFAALPWIIDSGSTSHMTAMPSIFTSTLQKSVHKSVTLADDSTSSIFCEDNTSLVPHLSLSLVFNIPFLLLIYYMLVK